MNREIILKFWKNDNDFLEKEYPNLSYKNRLSLWRGMFISEVRNSGEYSDGLAIFNIIEDIDACWSPWTEDCDWEDCSAEIYKRLGK